MPRRKGSFGRRRGGSSSMSALVASLMREQRAAEDRAIFDAYENGGMYKGQKVTDSVILKYIAGRRDGYDTADPLYDEWNNRLVQTKFSIGEQKIGLAFKQGKVGAGAVAAFYRGQLKDIPKDSAFYRDVAGRAAEWAKSASGSARGRARGRATSGLREKLNKTLNDQQTYYALERAITEYARREGIISGTQTLQEADATALTEMFDRGLYAGEDRITLIDFRQAAKDNLGLLDREVQLQQALGNQGIVARNKRTKFLNDTIMGLNAVDDRAKYELARDDLVEKLKAADEDPYAAAEAYKEYADQLRTIYETASGVDPSTLNQNDTDFIGGLANEYNLVTTGKSTGKTVADLYDISDILGNSAQQEEQFARLNADLERLNSGKAYFGQKEPGGPLMVVDWPAGYGTNPLGIDDSLQVSISTINGQKRPIYLRGEAVSASTITTEDGVAIDPYNGDFTPDEIRQGLSDGRFQIETGANVGYRFTNPATGDVKYGVKDPVTGAMTFTDENPWSADPFAGEKGLTVLSSALNERGAPDPAAALRRLATGAVAYQAQSVPFLSDTDVSLKELNRLVETGAVNLEQGELDEYRARLARRESDRLRTQYRQEDQFSSLERVDPAPRGFNTSGSPDERGIAERMRQGMDELSVTVNRLMNSSGSPDDRNTFSIPPPPKPPAVKIETPAPSTQGPGGITLEPGTGFVYGSGGPKPPKPEPTPAPDPVIHNGLPAQYGNY